MRIHLLSGFLGSGKTTAIQSACKYLLESGIKTGVITNDQGIKLVDADFFKHLGVSGRQVMGGCFCCNYKDLDQHIQSLEETEKPAVIFAESVGSCTDIIATVLKPLRRFRPDARIDLSVFADALLLYMLFIECDVLFEEEVNYIYHKQLEEADLLIINKADLLDVQKLNRLKKIMSEKFGDKILLYQNSLDHRSIGHWLNQLEHQLSRTIPASLEIDYQIYGDGEAKLAWLDQEVEVESADGKANQGAVDLIEDIYGEITRRGYPIGHLKFLMNGREKLSFTSISSPKIDFPIRQAPSAFLLMNARVQTDPQTLEQLVSDAIRNREKRSNVSLKIKSISAFQPGFPTPTHRMV
jgi:Ni2+-binding GTPase involved in maturation of urease and hydrogenase